MPNRSIVADSTSIALLSIANLSERHIVSAMLTRYALRLAGIAIIAGAGISRGAAPIEMYPSNTSGALVSRPSDYALATVADDGTQTFTVDGRAGDGFHWFLSIGDDAAAKCRVQYSMTGDNVGRFEARHNVWIELRERRGDGSKLVSLFTAAGSKDEIIAEVDFSTDARYRAHGIHIELGVRRTGIAKLTIDKLRIDYDGNVPSDEALAAVLSQPPAFTASVRPGVDAVDLMVDDALLPGISYGKPRFGQEAHEQMRLAGVRVHRVRINGGGPSGEYARLDPIWKRPEYFDYVALDRALGKVCRPDVDVIIEILLQRPPNWWFDEHVDNAPVSDLDPAWRTYAAKLLRLVLARVREGRYPGRIIGCHVLLGAGLNERPWPERENHGAYTAVFRQWLTTQYGTDEALREAWKSDTVTLQSATPEPIKRWPRGSVGLLIHPQANRAGIDSMRFYNRSWADTHLFLAAEIKKATQGRYLTGIVDGPLLLMANRWDNTYDPAAAAILPILESAVVDYLEVPASLLFTSHGSEMAGVELLLCEMARRHGKYFWVRLVKPTPSILRRTFVATLTESCGLHVVTDRSPETPVAELQAWARIQDKARVLPRGRPRELAIVVDPGIGLNLAPDPAAAVLTGQAPQTRLSGFDNAGVQDVSPSRRSQSASLPFYLTEAPRTAWSRSGVPWEAVFIDDFDPGRYRIIVFYHILQLTDARRKIMNSCKNDERTVVWQWADVIIGDNTISSKNQREMFGIDVRLKPGGWPLHLKPSEVLANIVPSDYWFSWDFCGGRRYGDRGAADVAINPMFVVDDNDAQILARHESGEAAIAMKILPDWNSIYSASPVLDPVLLRTAARQSGAHIYLDSDDILFVNDSFIAIYTMRDGVRALNLPASQPLYEVFRDQILATAESHNIDLKDRRTYLFYRGTKEAWMAAAE